MGKILTVHNHGIEKKFQRSLVIFRLIFCSKHLSWDTKSLLRCQFYVLQGLREEKADKVYTRQKMYRRQYITKKAFLCENVRYAVLQGSLTNEINLKGLLYYLVLLD